MNTHQVRQAGKSLWDVWLQSAALAMIAAIALVVLLSGCLAQSGNKEASSGGSSITWTDLTSGSGALVTCARSGCHTGGSPPQGLSLDSDQYTTLVTDGATSAENPSLRIVEPGDKANSELYIKVSSGSMSTYAGTSGAKEIGEWIDAGAPQ